MKLKALIVEDEKEAANALKLLLLKTCPDIDIEGICESAVEAAKALKKTPVDILFLDIEMPGGTGFDVIEMIDQKKLYVIFTTAHNEYAIKALKKGVKDYLLKPIDPDELIMAVERVKELQDKSNSPRHYKNTGTITINTSKEVVFVEKEEVIYLKAAGRYTEVFCKKKKQYTVCKNIGEFESELGKDLFFRVHKSYLINCKHVQKINSVDGGFVVMSNKTEIEISKRRKSDFLKFLK